MHETILQARAEPAALRPDRECKAAFGPFCDAILRLHTGQGLFTPGMADVARLLAKRTLLQGFNSIEFRTLEDLTRLPSRPDEDARFFSGWAANDLSRVIRGWWDGAALRPGLAGFGIVRVEQKAVIEAGVPPVSILLVMADVASWTVPVGAWRSSAEELAALVVHPLACRQRWTGCLPSLVREPDLHDALASPPARAARDARRVENERQDAAACRGGVLGRSHGEDARAAGGSRPRVVDGGGVSEVRKAESRGTVGVLPKFGTVAGAAVNSEQKKQKTVQPLNSYLRVNDENRLLAELKVEFARAHGQNDADNEMVNYGGAWRQLARANPDLLERETAALRAHISEGGKFSWAAWHFVRHYTLKSIGVHTWAAAAARNFKESF